LVIEGLYQLLPIDPTTMIST